MTELKCIAIDDEPLALLLIRQYISRIPALKLLQTFEDAVSGAEYLKHNTVDLLFIDINMPDITGIDLVCSLPQKPLTIFITAYRKFAVEGFELDAIDYLLKPVDFERFQKAARKAIEFYEYRNSAQAGGTESLFVRSEYKMVRIPLRDILYIEGLKDYIRIQQAQGKPVLSLMTMKAVMDRLPAGRFVRIHRSYIIPIDKIAAVLNKKIRLLNNEELPVSDSYLDDIKKLIQ